MDEKWQKILLLGGFALAFYLFYKQGTEPENGENGGPQGEPGDLTIQTEGPGKVQVEINEVIQGEFEENTFDNLEYGTSVVLEAVPNSGAIFESFDKAKDFTINGDITVTAYFQQETGTNNPYNLTDSEWNLISDQLQACLQDPTKLPGLPIPLGPAGELTWLTIIEYPDNLGNWAAFEAVDYDKQERAEKIATLIKVGGTNKIKSVYTWDKLGTIWPWTPMPPLKTYEEIMNRLRQFEV